MNTEINNIVLTSSISETISILQNGVASACEKQQAERQKAIANFIGQNYSPIGTTSQKCYKTTAELVYELSNIVDVAPMALAKQLADAGYHVEYLAGQPYWVMYEKP